MKFEKEFFIGAMDVDWQKRLSNRALIEMFSNITMYHGAVVGHTSVTGISPVSWMAMNYKMQVFSRPVMFGTVKVQTWISSYNKVRATREYNVFDDGDNLVAKCTAIWVAIDGETGSPLRMTDELMKDYEKEDECCFPSYQFINARKFELDSPDVRELELHRMMDDYNGHVHNSAYLDIAQEALPEDIFRGTFDDVEIAYKNEITSGGEVLLEHSAKDTVHEIAIRSPEDGRLHGAVVLSDLNLN